MVQSSLFSFVCISLLGMNLSYFGDISMHLLGFVLAQKVELRQGFIELLFIWFSSCLQYINCKRRKRFVPFAA